MKKATIKIIPGVFLIMCILLTLLPTAALATAPTTDFITFARPSFSDTDGLECSGSAGLDAVSSRIRLVPYGGNQVGGVFTADKVSMGGTGFSMAAQVYCGPTAAQADGFALVLSKDTKACVAESTGGSLGYTDMPDSLAVQYFTYAASNIALGIDGVQNRDESVNTGFGVPIGGYVYLWADYDAADTRLYVYAGTSGTRPVSPVQVYTVDLSGYADYYIGLTAATGGSYQEYAAAQWYYDDAYHSGSLSLDGSVGYIETVDPPAVVSRSAIGVTSSSATLRGVWGSDYDSGCDKGFEYKEGEAGEVTAVAAETDGTAALSGLTDGTAYYCRAYAASGETYFYGDWISFSTLNVYTVTVTGGYIGDNTETTSAEFDAGTFVTLTAPFIDGKQFTEWDDELSSAVSTENPYTFSVGGSVSLTAVYADGFYGRGTAADPYRITCEADLNRLSSLVALGSDFSDKYFVMTQDITMSADFTPIGDDYPFRGAFDGGGYAVTGLNISVSSYAGLFGYIEDATVENLTIDTASITSTTEYAGAVAGYTEGSSVISGCTVTGSTVTGYYESGGLVGYGDSGLAVTGCTVSGCTVSADYDAGGLIGDAYNDLTVTDCTVTDCDIDGSYYAGGLVGYMEDYNAVSSCISSGCTVDGEYAGGIVGYADEYAGIAYCTVSDLLISDSEYAGGIAGYANDYHSFISCTVSDSVISSADYAGGITGYFDDYNTVGHCTVTNCAIQGYYESGGIAGFMYYNPQVFNCVVSGGSVAVGDTGYYAGGIIGEIDSYEYSADISRCRVTCDVTASGSTYNKYAGGIVGYGYASGVNIDNCEYSGTVLAEVESGCAYAGGIVAYSVSYDSGYEGAAITNCVAYGTVTASAAASSACAGGISAYSDDYSAAFANNVAMQSAVTGDYVSSLYVYAYAYSEDDSANEVTAENNFANASMILTGDPAGESGTATALADMDGAFWTGLGFTAAGQWNLTADGNITGAPAEAHLGTAQPYTLRVYGNAVPYYMGVALPAGGGGSYTVYAGSEITMKSSSIDYKISGLSVNGTAVTAKPWRFTVTGDTSVTVTLEENHGDFWVSGGYYVFGKYDENSTYDDIDWTGKVNSSVTPLSGDYANADVYIFDWNSVYIGRLDLGGGSVINKTCGSDIDLYGSYADSFLAADSIIGEYDSDDLYLYDLAVDVNYILMNDELDCENVRLTADTITVIINCCGIDIYDGSSLTVGTIYAAVGDPGGSACIWVGNDSILTADRITGCLDFEASDNGIAYIKGDLETDYFDAWNSAFVTIGGDLVVPDDCAVLYDYAILDVKGTVSVDALDVYSLNSAVLDALSGGTVPHYYYSGAAYIRTTLTGLPVNTLMTFETSGGTDDMSFTARTGADGTLTAWLLSDGGTVTAATAELVIYTGADTVGGEAAEIAMDNDNAITDVVITADVAPAQRSGQAVSYGNIQKSCADSGYTFVDGCFNVSLADIRNQAVALDSELTDGTYYLTFTYADELNLVYGTVTYVVTVKDRYTVSFDANGGSEVDGMTALNGESITLPSSTRSGYRLTGWSDGMDTYAEGALYTVTQDVTLTAQWSKRTSSVATYTITASAGEGGSISPSGSVTVAEGGDRTFTITAADGYYIRNVLVDGASIGAAGSYTFEDIDAAHTISAVFAEGTGWVNPFGDIGEGDWFYDAVKFAAQSGLMNGTSQGEFAPGSSLTRGMLVTILYRLESEPSFSGAAAFDDVASDIWYADAVAWASSNGIVGGYGNGAFGPEDNITREQIAVILYNYALYKGYDTGSSSELGAFTDAGDTSSWAQAAVKWAAANGLMSGRGGGILDPGGTATRAEIATILMRFIEAFVK